MFCQLCTAAKTANMKTIIVLLVIAQLAFGHIQPLGFAGLEREIEIEPRLVKEKIQKILDCVKNLAQNGNAEIGLPVIDPSHVEGLTVDLSTLNIPGASGQITVSNFDFKGWSQWTFPRFTESVTLLPPGMRIGLTLLMESIEVDGEYDINLTINGKTITGKGKISGVIKNAKVDLDTHVTLAIKIRSLSIVPHIEAVQLSLDELVVDGVDYSDRIAEVSAKIAAFVNDNAKAISDKLSAAIIDAVNNRSALTADGKPDDLSQIIEAFKSCIKL